MTDFKIDERTKLGATYSIKAWLAGGFAFVTTIVTIVAVGVAGWYAMRERLNLQDARSARIEERMITRESLEAFMDRLLTQLPTIAATTESKIHLEALKDTVEKMESRLSRLEQRP